MDLYNIPGDTGDNWRLNKFVEYQHEVPSIHYRLLGEYIKRNSLSKNDAVMMCWYLSTTYNEITCILLHEIFKWKELTPKTLKPYCNDFWVEMKPFLDFGSARRYAKSMDWYPKILENVIRKTKKHPYRWLKSLEGKTPKESYDNVFKNLRSTPYVGRFAAELFMELALYIQDYLEFPCEETSKLDWKDCSNLTSGLLNIFYLDEEADLYDEKKRLPVTEEFLTEKIEVVQKAIKKRYPKQDNDINLFSGKICSFRNLFKNKRYGGFHHDRELGVIRTYEKTLPQYQHLWDEIFDIRQDLFDPRFLGELHNWNGIRKERKKLWLTKGLTGVEYDS